jgi:AcrR family transcriptional regulator
MTGTTVQQTRVAAVREQVLEGAAALLAGGAPLTFAALASAARVPERTIYRYFPTREALLAALFDWANHRIGFDGELPRDRDDAVALVRRVFPGFDEHAPVVRELLVSREGLDVRLSSIDARRRAARALVRQEAPGLDRTTSRRVAAIVQLLTTASTWQTLTQYWDMDGREAAETAALAIELVLDAARDRTT